MKKILFTFILMLLFPIVVNAKTVSISAFIEDANERKVIDKIDFVFQTDRENEFSEENLAVFTVDSTNDYKKTEKNIDYNITSFVFAKIYMSGNTIDSYGIYNTVLDSGNVDDDGNYTYSFTIKTNPNSHVKTSYATTAQTTTAEPEIEGKLTSSTKSTSTPNDDEVNSKISDYFKTDKTVITDKNGNIITTEIVDPILKEKEEQEKKKKEEEKKKKRFDIYLMVWVILALVVLVFVLITIVKALRASKIK